MPEYVGTIEIWFDAEDIADAEESLDLYAEELEVQFADINHTEPNDPEIY